MSTSPDFVPQRVAVALSGGVDSSVVSALLKQSGAEVIALTMLLKDDDDPGDAVRVTQLLGIEHHIVDLRKEFAATVKDAFAKSYTQGETPVPCAVCNREIKFGKLMEEAKRRGAQALATGHYARLIRQEGRPTELHKGTDLTRDQSYFLFALSQEQVDFLLFPIGHIPKTETRALAAQFGLPVAEKKDSQDICFVPCGDYADVVQKLKPEAILSGEIVDQNGQLLGTHKGIIHFTVGQRKGLSLSNRTGDHNEPLFVLALDAQKRQVIVGPREALARRRVFLRDVNWLAGSGHVPEEGLAVTTRLRSSQHPMPARFHWNPQNGQGTLTLDEPTLGVAKGQAGVIYADTRVLGGGWIIGAE